MRSRCVPGHFFRVGRGLGTRLTLYVTLCTSTVGIATHGTLKKKKEETSLSYLKWSYKATLWISSQTPIERCIVSWLRDVVKLTQWSTSFVINYHLGVTGIIEFRKRSRSKRRGSRGSCMQNVHTQKHTVYIISCCKNYFMYLIFMGGATHENFSIMEISWSTVFSDARTTLNVLENGELICVHMLCMCLCVTYR